MVVNIALSVIKVAIGLSAASLAFVADGIHSLSDFATDVAVLLGLRLGSKEPDQSHPYGHGRQGSLSRFAHPRRPGIENNRRPRNC